jgi:hypothetical protein
LQYRNVVLHSELLDRAWHQLLTASRRAIGLGVDRDHFIRAVEQGFEVFGGEFRGAGEDDAQWLSHGLLVLKSVKKEKASKRPFGVKGSSVLLVQFFELFLDPVTLEIRQVVDEQLAVQVIALVLDAHREQPSAISS